MRMASLVAILMLAAVAGCKTAGDVLDVPVQETIAAKDAEGHFNKSKLKGIDARFQGDMAVFNCLPPKCPSPVDAFFQMATLSQDEQELIAADRAKGYANLSDEVSRTFILPGNGTPESSIRSAPVLASFSGVTALEQAVVARDEAAEGPKAAHVVILAERGQSSVIVTLARSPEDAARMAEYLKAAWRP